MNFDRKKERRKKKEHHLAVLELSASPQLKIKLYQLDTRGRFHVECTQLYQSPPAEKSSLGTLTEDDEDRSGCFVVSIKVETQSVKLIR